MEKLIVYLGINEGVTKAQNPNVPTTPEEIADDVKRCVDEGVSIVHFHVADPVTGFNPSPDPETNLAVYRAVRRKADVMLYPSAPADFRHVTTAARDRESLAEIGPVIAPPLAVWASADVEGKKFDFPGGTINARAPRAPVADMYEAFVSQTQLCAEYDLIVSHDVMEPAGMRNIDALHKMGLYERPVLLKFFFSEEKLYGMPVEPRFLQAYVDMIPRGLDHEWLVLPYGASFKTSIAMWSYAITHGGHVRVGIGDNPAGEGYLPTNPERVRQIVQLARTMGREIASVEEVRERFKPFVRRERHGAGVDERPLVSAGYASQ